MGRQRGPRRPARLAAGAVRRRGRRRRAAPAAWIAAGEVFGDDPSFRSWLDRTDRPYVLATRSQDRVAAGAAGAGTVHEVVRGLPDVAWRRAPGRTGREWARVPLPQPAGFDREWERLILAVRTTTEPDRTVCYRCRVPPGTPDRDLIR